MNIIFLLIIISLIIAIGFLAAFVWAVRAGQYEDDYTPSVRMLFDDKPSSGKTQNSTESTSEAPARRRVATISPNIEKK